MARSSSSSWRPAPELYVRGPVRGVLTAPEQIEWSQWVNASGVRDPTVLAIDLEGRFATPSALIELVLPLAKSASSGAYGQLALIFCTPDEATKMVLRALGQAHGASFFIAPSVSVLREAEPVGPLTSADLDTLQKLRELGGQTTVSVFAAEASLEASAANNRVVSLQEKGLIQVKNRSRREGKLVMDPRSAVPAEQPSSSAIDLPEAVRTDLKAIAHMTGRDPDSILAEAMEEMMERHREVLDREQERMRRALEDDDEDALTEISERYPRSGASRRRARRHRSGSPE